MQGLAGNNSYLVDNAADVIVDTAGIDNVNASVSYTLAANVAVETLRTTNAAGTTALNLFGNNLANIVTGNAGNNIISGGGGVDKLQGLGRQQLLCRRQRSRRGRRHRRHRQCERLGELYARRQAWRWRRCASSTPPARPPST